jgi:Gametolysin peptidase M11
MVRSLALVVSVSASVAVADGHHAPLLGPVVASTAARPTVHTDNFASGRTTVRDWTSPVTLTGAKRRLSTERREAATAAGRTVAVVLVNFANDRSEPVTPDAIRQLVFGQTGSVRALLQEESFGKVNLVGRNRADGDVIGWIKLDSTSAGCKSDDWSVEADEIAARNGVNLGGYDHVIFAWPKTASCVWIGRASVPGSVAWINGGFAVRPIVHELGHNLGLYHSTSLRCVEGAQRVAISASCTRDEYGDPFDPMGGNGAGAPHSSAWQKVRGGWLPTSSVQTATATGTYGVAPLEQLSSSAQLLRVPRCKSPGAYFLDVRQPFGFDSYAPTDPAVTGVGLRLNAETSVATFSTLLDATPETDTFLDAPIGVGRTFTDPAEGLSISVVAVGPSGAQVAIRMPLAGRPRSVTGSVSGPGAVELKWQPPAAGCAAITGYRVLRDGAEIGTTTQTSYNDLKAPLGGAASYSVRAVDVSGPGEPSEAVTVSVASKDGSIAGTLSGVTVSAPSVAKSANGRGLTVTSTVRGTRSGVCRLERVVRGRWRAAGRWSKLDIAGRCRVKAPRAKPKVIFRVRFVGRAAQIQAAGPSFSLPR